MENLLAAKLHAILVQTRKTQHLSLDINIAILRENLHESLEDDIGWNSLREKLVESITNLFETSWRLLADDEIASFIEESLPVDFGYTLILRERILLDFAGFKHENCASKISFRLFCDAHGEFVGQLEAFFVGDCLKFIEIYKNSIKTRLLSHSTHI